MALRYTTSHCYNINPLYLFYQLLSIMITSTKPVLGFAAFSGTGKTTLLEKLIPQLGTLGITVGLIKHTHHSFDIDTPGKDSYRLRKAGANQTLVASGQRWALMTEEIPAKTDPMLSDLLPKLDQSSISLILVEGFKHEKIKKIELHRPALGKPLLAPDDPNIIAIATDDPHLVENNQQIIQCPILDINSTEQIAHFILGYVNRNG